MAVPAVESVHLQRPEPRGQVANDDQAIGIPDVNAEGAVANLVSAGTRLIRTVVRVVEADGVGIGRVHHVEHLQAVLIMGYEDVRPAYFVIVRQTLPVCGPRTDGPG